MSDDKPAVEPAEKQHKRIAVEEMGLTTEQRSVRLSEDFIRSYVDIDEDAVCDPNTGAKLACPFCQLGTIELANVDLTLTDHGPMLSRRINGYEVYLRCNCSCGAAFFGSVRTLFD